MESKENVNHPQHYQGKNECIDVMRAMFGDKAVMDFCRLNAFKYRFRSAAKNGAEDIKKAEWYETYLINMQKGESDDRVQHLRKSYRGEKLSQSRI